jgi:Domain of unknown function (DUF4262)
MPSQNRPFQTARTRHFRATDLNEQDERTISHIEEFGCSIVQVPSSVSGPGWSYTVGVHDTAGGAEIITVGLREKTASFLLNEAARRLRAGTDLTEGRLSGMIGDVECEFRPVDAKWVKHLMGWAVWYYQWTDFPVLQAVYPDLKNRFPGEPGFDEKFQQPLMQPDSPMERTEHDFWASADPKSSLFDWKFSDSPHTTAYLSETVYKRTEPITYVSHDSDDGAWQFLGPSMDGGGGPVLTCLHHPIDDDPSLQELADLPVGWCAERNEPKGAWIRKEQGPVSETE